MALITFHDLRQVIHPHYVINILLALSFIVCKTLQPFCSLLFDECILNHRESEILFFTAVIIVFRTRKQGAVNFLPYIGTACMLAKLGNVLLWFYADPIYGVVYSVCCLLHLLIMPEPCYKGPENMVYLDEASLENVLEKDRGVTWLIELYAVWNPACIEFAPIFSELSAKYALPNLKFGKVELSRNPGVATRFKVNTSPLSKQIPTLLLFKNGKEELRRPLVNKTGKLVSFNFNYTNVASTFELDTLFRECKNAQAKQPKSKGHLKNE
ncbi:thioredoxin-related transmembrane protein 2 homolog [Brevipalpus obovatus]|uniref:thioredoxin-related transmembrane protein 2 homolog n=1 Tax=Brevipalpus obovatus TaxID=246614 RepID=UPI003D9F29F3